LLSSGVSGAKVFSGARILQNLQVLYEDRS
jgi:hypothetical protein